MNTWSKFTNEWSIREQEAMVSLNIDRKFVDPKEDLNVKNHERVRTFIEPIESELKRVTMLKLKLIDLRKIASDRFQYAHEPIRSVAEQRDMITKCLNHVYPAEYKYTLMVKNMVLKLAERDQDISKSGLKAIVENENKL
ncbi:unnamed protein product [Rotaria sordida]|uniref:Uncharacterized protein n=1 Tax=Rotaria sordida TaxID=392033 RepID=A0A813XTC4_9BILA|nr:unnamed protein product [Rotaria sordida]CAF3595259.1 unnamed protein product [Rotaria sordida]